MANIHTLQQYRGASGSGGQSSTITTTASARSDAMRPRMQNGAQLQFNTTSRAQQSAARPVNIMVDPRVYRGTTYTTASAASVHRSVISMREFLSLMLLYRVNHLKHNVRMKSNNGQRLPVVCKNHCAHRRLPQWRDVPTWKSRPISTWKN